MDWSFSNVTRQTITEVLVNSEVRIDQITTERLLKITANCTFPSVLKLKDFKVLTPSCLEISRDLLDKLSGSVILFEKT